FDFDYDLTWMGFFLDAGGHVYGRYGGRGAESAEGRVSLAGLRYAMDAPLAPHPRGGPAGGRRHGAAPPPPAPGGGARRAAAAGGGVRPLPPGLRPPAAGPPGPGRVAA